MRSAERDPRDGAGSRPPWNHNVAYHHVVLDAMPTPCPSAVDVGCGQGLLLADLARRADRVLGIEPDPAAFSEASARSADLPNVTLACEDVLTADLPLRSFDLVACIAVLHHLPTEAGLERLADLVRPGGVLVVVGLRRDRGPVDLAFAGAGLVVSRALRLVRGHTEVTAPTLDPTTTLDDIRAAAARIVPGASIRRRLLFRYTLTWHRPPA